MFGITAALVAVAFVVPAAATLPRNSAPSSIALLNLSYVRAMDPVAGYEELNLAASIAGLANRDGPRLFCAFHPADAEWLAWARAPGGWLSQASVQTLANVTDAVQAFRSLAEGVAVYEQSVPVTSLLATTAAGTEGLLPVRDGSPLQQALTTELGLAVGLNFTGWFGPGGSHRTTPSIKADAYSWAIQRWLDGSSSSSSSNVTLADGRVLGYFVDAWAASHPVSDFYDKATVLNHDWVVARGGFLFDLGAWGDEVPKDDPGQAPGTDLKTLQSLLLASYEQNGGREWTHVAGFTPWAFKYVNSKHPGVATEWQTVRIMTAYNAFVDADACCIGGFSAASFWQHLPLPRRVPPVARPSSLPSLLSRGIVRRSASGGLSVAPGYLYYFFYQGDYDSAAWLQSQALQRWEDPSRGMLPLSWPFDPVLSRRFPPAFARFPPAATANDTFTTGDSGAAYMNPPMLTAAARSSVSGLPSGSDAWAALSAPLYGRAGVRFSGFLINGDAGPILPETEELYGTFSPDGMAELGFPGVVPHVAPGPAQAPAFPHTDIPTSAPSAAQLIAQQMAGLVPNASSPSSFHMYRSVLTSPSYLQQVEAATSQLTGGRARLLSPTDVGALVRVAFGAADANDRRVTFLSDSLPDDWPLSQPLSSKLRLAACNQQSGLTLAVSLRNDGWADIPASSAAVQVNVSIAALPPPGKAASLAPRGSWEARDRLLRDSDASSPPLAMSTYSLSLSGDAPAGGSPVQAQGELGGAAEAGACPSAAGAVAVVEYGVAEGGVLLAGVPVWREAFLLASST